MFPGEAGGGRWSDQRNKRGDGPQERRNTGEGEDKEHPDSHRIGSDTLPGDRGQEILIT